MTRLTLTLLGIPGITLEGATIPKTRYARIKALLFFLAVESKHAHQREVIADLLTPPDSADPRSTLRGVIRDLRSVLGETAQDPNFILTDRRTIRFNPTSDYTLDVERFRRFLHKVNHHKHDTLQTCPVCIASLRQAVALYQGHFLQDFYLGDCRFDEWADMTRRDLRRQVVFALDNLVDFEMRRGHFQDALHHAQRWMELDCCNEKPLQKAAWLLAVLGQTTNALKQIQDGEKRIFNDIGTPVTPATRALAEKIRTRPEAFRNNLPPQENPLIGREKEQNRLSAYFLQKGNRVVVLMGHGGTGKTRLAWQAAWRLLGELDGVFWIPLTSDYDGRYLAQQVAHIVGIQISGKDSLEDQVKNALQARTVLLVLDGAEKAKSDVEDWLSDLLPACSDLKVLITSREKIALNNIVLNKIGSDTPARATDLDTPVIQGLLPLLPREGVRLFIDRAIQVTPDFQVDNTSAPPVAQIHHLVNGVPLALELSAVHVENISVSLLAQEIEAYLQREHTTLSQQVLWKILEWHINQIPKQERIMLRQLSIFSGGWSAEAAQAVCDGDLSADDVHEQLQSLKHKALIREDVSSDVRRYLMLDEIQRFARQYLEQDEIHRLQARHLQYFQNFAEHINNQFKKEQNAEPLVLLGLEQGNLRLALQTALNQQNGEAALQLVINLFGFWYMRGYAREGLQWARQSLALCTRSSSAACSDSPLMGKALLVAGNLSLAIAQLEQAEAYYQQAYALATRLGNDELLGHLNMSLSSVYAHRGQIDSARDCTQKSINIFKKLNKPEQVIRASVNLAVFATEQGDYATARQVYDEIVPILRKQHNRRVLGAALFNHAKLYKRVGQKDVARTLYLESLQIQKELNYEMGIARCYNNLGDLECNDGNLEKSRAYYLRSAEIWHEIGNPHELSITLEGIAEVEMLSGEWESAAWLMSASLALKKRAGSKSPAAQQKSTDSLMGQLRAHFPPPEFERIWNEGKAASIDEIMARLEN